ncbi:MAG TPA: 1,4-dihydroxy-6-naphthoate synthase [Planctomycetota bacterium]|nr:1,4-dihydroxy-6-naphthoate synthase [Planctomycetota bacterium]
MAARALTIAFSPCPNDTFVFHGLVHGFVSLPGFAPRAELLDIEELNLRARDPARAHPISKMSVATFAAVRDRYVLLDAGAALGRGCGPLVVALPGAIEGGLAGLAGRRVAIPGAGTTAALLLRRFAPRDVQPVAMRFDAIMPAVVAREVDAGVVIHEGRFTYEALGLQALADLGVLWEEATGLPLPLGVVAALAALGDDVIRRIDAALRASVELARARPELSREFVRAHAQELSEEVCRQHIELYVNEFTVALGVEGRRAIEQLVRAAS